MLEDLRFFPVLFTSSEEAKEFIVLERQSTGLVCLVITNMVYVGGGGGCLYVSYQYFKDDRRLWNAIIAGH